MKSTPVRKFFSLPSLSIAAGVEAVALQSQIDEESTRFRSPKCLDRFSVQSDLPRPEDRQSQVGHSDYSQHVRICDSEAKTNY